MEIQEPLKQDSQEIEIEEGKRGSENTIRVAQKNMQYLQNYDFRSQRISVGLRNIQTNNQASIEFLLPLQKESKTDSLYKIFIYYQNGIYELWDIQDSQQSKMLQQSQLSDQCSKFTQIDSNHILFIDRGNENDERCQLQILNVKQNEVVFQPRLQNPLLETWKNCDIQNLNILMDNTYIQYYQQYKILLICQKQQIYSFGDQQGNYVILTYKFDIEQKLMRPLQTFKISNPFGKSKEIQLVQNKDNSNKAIFYAPIVGETHFQYFCIKIDDKNEHVQTEDDIQIKIIQDINDTVIINGFTKNESEIYLIANPNNKDTPQIYQIDLDQNQVAIIEINKSELQKWGQEDGFLITEVYNYNQFNNIMVFKVGSNLSADIVYDPINNEIQHIKEQLEDDWDFQSYFSQDGSYYISFKQNNLQQFDESTQEPQQIDLYINSLISIKSSIIHIMEQSKLMDIYVPSKNKSQLKENQKPDFENEQFLQDVINCLTIGIKQ